MYVIYGDIFNPQTYVGGFLRRSLNICPDSICLTTNGYIKKKDSAAVMGAGVAKQAKSYWPYIEMTLGQHLIKNGNVVGILIERTHKNNMPYNVISFPVKPINMVLNHENIDSLVPWMKNKFRYLDLVPGWACMAQMDIIRDSAKQLVKITDENNWKHVIVPKPGCGAGALKWKDVEGSLSKIFDNRFYIIDRK